MDPRIEETIGGINHNLFLKISKTLMSKSCPARKAAPDAITILKRIKLNSSKVKINDKAIPKTNPKNTIFLANSFPKNLFARSVTRKVTGYVKAPQVKISLSPKYSKGNCTK